jgi:hypothetical protein
MGSLLPGWNAAAEAPSPTRRWSDTVRRQDLETLRREERRHREARARLSAAAARADDAVARLRAGAARASSPGPPFAGTPPVGSRRREDEEDEEDEFFDEATEDLLREMRLGAWHRLLSDARRSLEPDPGDGELSVDSAVVSGVAAALNADSASFGDARRKTRALDALALEKSGGRGRFFSTANETEAVSETPKRRLGTTTEAPPSLSGRSTSQRERRRACACVSRWWTTTAAAKKKKKKKKKKRSRFSRETPTARASCASSRRRAGGARRRRRRRRRRVPRAGGTERRART